MLGELIPQAGEVWMTSGWRQVPRFVKVQKVANDEVTFELDNGQVSTTTQSAFLRMYTFYPDLTSPNAPFEGS